LAETPYVVLLNNDAEVTPGWLSPMVDAAERDSSIGAAQPKILSLQDPHRFDYCGACGGEIDLFGYPFARGRLFDTLEIDAGQYDTGGPVFWATGAATLLRKSALEHAGLLDESFFAHMEEIDLNWRFHLSGYRVVVVPEAVVYHETGGTLGQESYQKMVLNHRNSLLMLLKNLSGSSLVWIFPIRLFLEGITFVVSFFSGRFKRALAVAAGFFGAIVCWQSVLEGRKQVKAIRIVPEFKILHQMYRGSTAILYFLFGVKRANELKLSRRTE
jgi:GT2 family glycosyltransferase